MESSRTPNPARSAPGRAADEGGAHEPPVTCEREQTLLVVPVEDGAAELWRAAALRGSARKLFELGPEREPDELAAALVGSGASPARAEADARSFVVELRRRGLRAGSVAPEPAGARAEPAPVTTPTSPAAADEAGYRLEAEDLEALARAVLGAGRRLRFRASGRSMRPFLPHGSVLEVVPASFASVGVGEVVLYAGEEHRLVAHRVLERDGGCLVTRGDSSSRLDRVDAAGYLGRVDEARVPRRGGELARVPVSTGHRRVLGLVLGRLHAWGSAAARVLVVEPLRRSFGGRSAVRAVLRALLRVVSGVLRRTERLLAHLRRPTDALLSALFSTQEKDAERRALYRRRTVQGFTSLEENVAAGLTLIEEAILARHVPAPCRTLVLGSGPGRECLALAARGFEVTGVDREPGMLERARKLAAERAVDVRYERGEVDDFRVEGPPFGLVTAFSGLYCMVLPRARRVAMLARAREHLLLGGRVALTFLSAYRPPGAPPAPRARTFLESLNPEHEDGDLWLLNEAVHVFPRAEDVADEAREAGLEVETIWRDQRAYDRFEGRVKGYALLRRPGG